MMKAMVFGMIVGMVFLSSCACPFAPKEGVFFKNLSDGDVVTSPFKVEMGVIGMEVKPAGTMDEGTGHHHIIINKVEGIKDGEVVPADATHLHFGAAQTEAELKLDKGDYTLTLQFADGLHRSYGEKYRKTVKISVK